MSRGNDAYCGPDWTARDAVRALEARVALLEGRARVAEALPPVTLAALTEPQRAALERLEDAAQDAQARLVDYGGTYERYAGDLRCALAGMLAAGFPMRGADAGRKDADVRGADSTLRGNAWPSQAQHPTSQT